jgi:hypothetical protein
MILTFTYHPPKGPECDGINTQRTMRVCERTPDEPGFRPAFHLLPRHPLSGNIFSPTKLIKRYAQRVGAPRLARWYGRTDTQNVFSELKATYAHLNLKKEGGLDNRDMGYPWIYMMGNGAILKEAVFGASLIDLGRPLREKGFRTAADLFGKLGCEIEEDLRPTQIAYFHKINRPDLIL